MNTSVSKPQYDRSRKNYAVRWLDGDNKRHCKTFATRAEAVDHRRELLGWAPVSRPAKAKKRPADEAPRAVKGDTEADWAGELIWYRDELRRAVEEHDDDSLERLSKASRALGTLVGAHASNRDVRKLKKIIEELKQWQATKQRAGRHGTRLSAPSGSGDAPAGVVRRGDAVH